VKRQGGALFLSKRVIQQLFCRPNQGNRFDKILPKVAITQRKWYETIQANLIPT
jgi:hypothetical protein